ncbi:MAG: VWA domain-containing protein [Proteobacteria bacterium]|nr:VWA domain-containing protein [Pseudomonadota bacterium]
MKRSLALLVGFVALFSQQAAFAAGLIVVTEGVDERRLPSNPPIFAPPRPIVPPRPYSFAPLEVVSHQVNARITDQVAVTTIDQEFYNPNGTRLEGTFLLPVPKGAQLNKFTMEIDGKKVDAELLAADKARGIYENIVRTMRDPALLEYIGQDVFRVRIFPIEPHGKKRVSLSYTQVLKADGGLLNYVAPLNTAKFSARPLKNVSFKVELAGQRPIKSIWSPSHPVSLHRDGGKATVGFEATEVKPDTDFQLFFAFEAGELSANLLTHKVAGEDGYFILLAAPDVSTKGKVVPKDVCFVLDTSGSMAGGKLDQAKKALAFCVENLNDTDRFEVLRFSTEVEPLFDHLAEASEPNRRRAQDFIKGLKPLGSTAIDDALRKAMALRSPKADRQYVVVFLTDGLPTIGVTDGNAILRNVKEHSSGLTRIFCFGIGTDVNTHLLDKLADETKAFSTYVLPEEDLEVKLSAFYSKIKEPALANVKVTFPEGVRVTKLYPSPLPDLFKGEQLVLAGRYTGEVKGKLTISGSVAGEARSFSYQVDFGDKGGEHDFIPRLWATRRVGYLLDEIRLRGENGELKEEVTVLARKYSIVTPYTAWLITEDEAKRNVTMGRRLMPQLQTDRDAGRQAAESYDSFKKLKDGSVAVGGAQATYELKAANQSVASQSMANRSVVRSYSGPQPASPVPSGAPVTGLPALHVSTSAKATQSPVADAAARIATYAQQNQFVGGKSFYQNGAQWVDAEAQQLKDAKVVKLQFGSADYFVLLGKEPRAAQWLALGRNVQFVLGGTLYEVVD